MSRTNKSSYLPSQCMNHVKTEVIDYGFEASEYYGIIRYFLTKTGSVIGSLDMLIAAHAASKDMVLVTHNTSEFGRISG